MRTNDEIIQLLTQLKDEQNISISEIARRVGMAKSAVSRYFNKTREFPLNRAEEFANALGISQEYLLGLEADSNEDKLNTIFRKLDKPRQNEVIEFADFKLKSQNNVVTYPEQNEIHTLAAHRVDETETASPEDKARLMSKLDEMDRKFDEQQKRLKAKEAEKRGPFDE
ncbi:helix-turn-helix domain-containing protein [Enterococcus sp. 2201sp1_2201st1_B8_2201SCRN_220225]|uniref:helix-turn-helix domain-containing protein n=1 Tax=unclassified Enterococcus TaxID=2608891 RepID=UPI0034A4E4B9